MATTPITSTQAPLDAGTDGSTIDFANLGPYILTKFIEVLEAALIIIVGLFLIRYAKRYLRKLTVEHEQQKTALNLFEKLLTGFLIVISITLALRTVGIDMTLLVSVTILGLSYGLQDIIKNYVAGILIMFKSPFRIGDTIKIKDHTGKVDKIDFQSTTLRTFDQRDVTIYNSDVMTQSIVNFSRSNIRRLDIDVTLGYGSDHGRAFKIFEKILSSNTNLLQKPSHKVVFKKFDDNGTTFSIRAWVNFPCNILAIKSDLALQISQAFDEANIFIPYEKSIQAESDYTMTEKRQARSNNFGLDETSPDNSVPATSPNPFTAGEMIDFDEVE
ncbi:mechanosensitive ion channel [Candidatus Peregrinibacteria bacterium]|nr:mechanosensitive ion channel [Candidatus Peregrinibacteria bacterium]